MESTDRRAAVEAELFAFIEEVVTGELVQKKQPDVMAAVDVYTLWLRDEIKRLEDEILDCPATNHHSK